uniref:Uncharacterized protein n=1 Tax=Opuntia streptacantha TaxID=393608 RepID=A0A7C9B4S8_OPUST
MEAYQSTLDLSEQQDHPHRVQNTSPSYLSLEVEEQPKYEDAQIKLTHQMLKSGTQVPRKPQVSVFFFCGLWEKKYINTEDRGSELAKLRFINNSKKILLNS